MKIGYFILDILLIYPKLWIGWIRVLVRVLISSFYLFIELPLWRKIFFILGVLQTFYAARPWIEYSVQFLEQKEILQISVKSNLWIIFFLNLNLFGNLFFMEKIFYFTFFFQISTSILVSIGLIYPHLFFTNFLEQRDYNFSIHFYIFLLVHSITTLFHIIYLLKKRKTQHEKSTSDT